MQMKASHSALVHDHTLTEICQESACRQLFFVNCVDQSVGKTLVLTCARCNFFALCRWTIAKSGMSGRTNCCKPLSMYDSCCSARLPVGVGNSRVLQSRTVELCAGRT